MQKITELLGLPVIDLSTGKQIGKVQDVVIDVLNYRMMGVLLCHAGWFHSGRGIMLEDMKSIGSDSITIADEMVIFKQENLAAEQQTLLNEGIIGKHLVTTGGKTLGTLSDIYVDTKTGLLTGYELSDSVIRDLLEGRRTMPLPAVQKIGEETVVVGDSVIYEQQPVAKSKLE